MYSGMAAALLVVAIGSTILLIVDHFGGEAMLVGSFLLSSAWVCYRAALEAARKLHSLTTLFGQRRRGNER